MVTVPRPVGSTTSPKILGIVLELRSFQEANFLLQHYYKAPNHAIEECAVLLANIQEKQQNQNVQFIGIEQCTADPMVNVVMHSGAVTGG